MLNPYRLVPSPFLLRWFPGSRGVSEVAFSDDAQHLVLAQGEVAQLRGFAELRRRRGDRGMTWLGVSIVMGDPQMHGLFHGKSEDNMDDVGI